MILSCKVAEKVIKGIVDGCGKSNCALLVEILQRSPILSRRRRCSFKWFLFSKKVLLQKDELPGGSCSLGEALMPHTVIYVNQVLDFISK
ncbi:unnamed protein product [Microthlaspi erraticum]|uniref:Uncharacterized protein n=1 Tax=Microthlaspi erraticum TaxID=1685480 RepID=A0A6D2I7N1_9BRAS|nr:unnamed protein product [Microthlaspi erraticum]